MSAITEVARFGWLYWIIVSVSYIIMVRSINSRMLMRALGPLSIISANLVFTIYTITGFTYPLRNVFDPWFILR